MYKLDAEGMDGGLVSSFSRMILVHSGLRLISLSRTYKWWLVGSAPS